MAASRSYNTNASAPRAGGHPYSGGRRCGTMGPRLRGDDNGDRVSRMFPPERIVCLTEETVETLYLLGEDRRIVGVSGYAVRPPHADRAAGLPVHATTLNLHCGDSSSLRSGVFPRGFREHDPA